MNDLNTVEGALEKLERYWFGHIYDQIPEEIKANPDFHREFKRMKLVKGTLKNNDYEVWLLKQGDVLQKAWFGEDVYNFAQDNGIGLVYLMEGHRMLTIDELKDRFGL